MTQPAKMNELLSVTYIEVIDGSHHQIVMHHFVEVIRVLYHCLGNALPYGTRALHFPSGSSGNRCMSKWRDFQKMLLLFCSQLFLF